LERAPHTKSHQNCWQLLLFLFWSLNQIWNPIRILRFAGHFVSRRRFSLFVFFDDCCVRGFVFTQYAVNFHGLILNNLRETNGGIRGWTF